jgi:hypothetical protein
LNWSTLRYVFRQTGGQKCQAVLGNGFIESFNPRLRDELLNGEIFYALKEARIVRRSAHPCGAAIKA